MVSADTLTGVGLALSAAVAIAFSHVLAKECLRELPLAYFLKVRTLTGAASLALLATAWGQWGAIVALPPERIVALCAVGVMAPFVVNLFAFWAMARLPLNVMVPVQRTYPMFVLLLSLLVLGERLGGLALAGVIAISAGAIGFGREEAQRSDQPLRVTLLPLAAALVSSILFAVTQMLWRVFIDDWKMTPVAISLIQTAAAAPCWWAVDAARRRPVQAKGLTVAKTAASGVLVFAVANVLVLMAYRHLPTPAVSALNATSVLTVAGLAYLVLREKWSWRQVVGAVLIVGGTVGISIG